MSENIINEVTICWNTPSMSEWIQYHLEALEKRQEWIAPKILPLFEDELSDDFLYFCQHGKYPDTKVDQEFEALKKRNQQVNERKGFLAEEIFSIKYYDGFSYNKSITIQALLELAIELSPDTDTFCESCDDVIDRFCDDPHSVIDNQPR